MSVHKPNLIVPAAAATVVEPPVKVKPAIDLEILTAIDQDVMEDSFVYVHCYFDNPDDDSLIRIWRSTFLVDQATGSRARLMHAENISFAPIWTHVPGHAVFNFLLIFSALPKSCQVFDLVEDIPQAGGFHVTNIARTPRDVYHVDIH